MGRAKRANHIGKGKVTPVQVAFIVDRYLSDNNFSETRSVFRSEASSLISRSPVDEVPKSLLSLDEILNEYIYLKERKVSMDDEKARLEQEKIRVETLLQAMQGAMNAYNTSSRVPAPASQLTANKPMMIHDGSICIGQPVYSTPMPMGMPMPEQLVTKKRNVSDVSPPTGCRSTRSKITATKQGTGKLPASYNAVGSPVVAAQSTSTSNSGYEIGESSSSVAQECLFNQTSVPNSTCPMAQPQVVLPQSVNPISTSGIAHCTNSNSNITAQEIAPSTSTSETEKDTPISDLVLEELVNYCLSDVMVELGITSERTGFPC